MKRRRPSCISRTMCSSFAPELGDVPLPPTTVTRAPCQTGVAVGRAVASPGTIRMGSHFRAGRPAPRSGRGGGGFGSPPCPVAAPGRAARPLAPVAGRVVSHSYVLVAPGGTVCTGLRPAFAPSILPDVVADEVRVHRHLGRDRPARRVRSLHRDLRRVWFGLQRLARRQGRCRWSALPRPSRSPCTRARAVSDGALGRSGRRPCPPGSLTGEPIDEPEGIDDVRAVGQRLPLGADAEVALRRRHGGNGRARPRDGSSGPAARRACPGTRSGPR